ncbi:MAG TPA: hypothetical protein VEI01_25235 [Terriglobales bacterium]|nr:hypothetical protein [Terriglobales bacterium]
MFGHQSIQFVSGGAMNRGAIFPGENLVPQPFSQFPNGFYSPPGTGRSSPPALKLPSVAGSEQISCPKPSYNRTEIREQFQWLTMLDGARVYEIQRQVVAEKKEPVFPV